MRHENGQRELERFLSLAAAFARTLAKRVRRASGDEEVEHALASFNHQLTERAADSFAYAEMVGETAGITEMTQRILAVNRKEGF